MAERHDNTRPAHGGTISISRLGTFNYFPIEKGEGALRPFLALFLHEKTDGSLSCSIDTRFLGSVGELDE